MKGIVLAGGSGTRLHPLTLALSKQLLPVYNKPMIYYPLSTLFLAEIREILIISTPHDLPLFQNLLGDGSQFGVQFSYLPQEKPEGIAQSFLIAEEFIGDDDVCLILGDNIFHGGGIKKTLLESKQNNQGATFFGYTVKDPERYGVVVLDENRQVKAIEEKPKKPQSNIAVTGLYFYNNDVVDIAKNLTPSARGELEITDVNNVYIQRGQAHAQTLGRGFAWLDTGTPESMLQASHFVQVFEQRQGCYIAALEEIAYHQGWITHEELLQAAQNLSKGQYGQYLYQIANEAPCLNPENASLVSV